MIRSIAVTGSTSADLLIEATALPEGAWLRADRQTAGKGRLGRPWQSPPGNLYASTLVHLSRADPPAATLALVAAVAAHETAAAWAGPQAAALAIKWPNDLLLDGAKLAGIALERRGDAVVIGFGVNLASAPTDLGRPTAALATPETADPAAFLADLASAFARRLIAWRGPDGMAAIRRAWLARAHPAGTALLAAGREGLFEGLTETGALRLRRADGTIETVTAGDVSLL